MKILFVINSLSSGGAERVASRLCSFWSKENEVTLFQTSFSTKKEYAISEKIKYINYCDSKRVSRIRLIKLLRKTIKTINPDVVVSFLDTGHFYTSIALIGLKIPHVCSERNDPYNMPEKKLFRMMRHYAFSHCSAIVFQTEGARDFFGKKIRNKGVIIPNPIVNNYHISQIKNKEKTIIAAGRMVEQKNYPLLLKAFSEFSINHSDYLLNIFGRGPLENDLLAFAKKLGIEQKVFLRGFSTNIEEEMFSSSIYVMSSTHEGMPNSLMEAISLGTPSISTDANPGGPRFIISKCRGSILTKNNDVKELACAMDEIASNYKKYFDLTQLDAAMLKKEFSIDAIGNKWIELFKQLK